MSIKSMFFAATAAVAMSFGLTGGAQASSVTLDKEGASVWGSPVLARNVNYTLDGKARFHGAGQFQLQDVATLESILAFCIDIFQVLKLPHTYDTTPFVESLPMGQIEALYSNFYLDVDTADEAAGFQLALWEITTEKSATLDLGAGRFITTGTGAQYDIAETYLQGLAGKATAKWDLTTYFSPTSQDLISGSFGGLASVPVPVPAALLLTGLLGLGGLRARRNNKV